MTEASKTLDQLRSTAANPTRKPQTMAEIATLDRKRQFPAMLEAFKSQMAMALPEHLTAERMARLAMTAFNNNPTLHMADPNSVFAAVILSSQLGLEIGVDGEAYIVPYYDTKKKTYVAQFIPGWKGYVKLVNQAEKAAVWTGAVYVGDEFDFQLGDEPFCRHRPTGKSDETKANLLFVYAIGRIKATGERIIEVWPKAKVERHLKKYNKVGDRHYALANDGNFIQYGKKVALLQVVKYLPKSVQLRAAQAVERVGANAVDMADVLEGEWSNVAALAANENPDDGGTGEDANNVIEGEATTTTTAATGDGEPLGAAGATTPGPQQASEASPLPPSESASGKSAGRATRTKPAAGETGSGDLNLA